MWSTGAARRRRVYSIRRRGRVVLEDHLREWRLFARAVERVIAPASAGRAARVSRA